MEPTAFDEASRATRGRTYWIITGVLVVTTVAAWIWGEQWLRLTLGVLAMVFIVATGVITHVRMNRIVRDRSARTRSDAD